MSKSKKDDTAPATQGDVQYLAKLVTENTQRIEKLENKVDENFERFDKRFDALEQQMERSFLEIKGMFQKMTEHVSKSDQLLADHEQRIRTLEVAV